jgi:hypothetical protein
VVDVPGLPHREFTHRDDMARIDGAPEMAGCLRDVAHRPPICPEQSA